MNPVSILFSFRGRTTRIPFWLVTAFLIIWGQLIYQVVGPIDHSSPMDANTSLLGLLNLGLIMWVGLANQVKRFHDRDKSGWWVLLNLIPVIGALWIVLECGLMNGSNGVNRYGNKPFA